MSEFNISFEVVKLLLQVAWADHDVASAEASAILSFGRRHGLGEGELDAIRACLDGASKLPLPNIGVLRPHKDAVLRELEELLHSDLHVSDEETSILAQISDLLDD